MRHLLKKFDLQNYVLFFSPYSLKLLYFDPELHFVHVSIVEFKRREKKKELLKNNEGERK
jgi:hypothetical protein